MLQLLKLAFLISMFFSMLVQASELRISVDALLAEQDRVLIIDARPKEAYEAAHLPNAINLPFALTFAEMGVTGRMISLDKAASLFGDLGVTMQRPVVVYDAGGMFQAARVLAILEILGHTNIRLLDGGLAAWKAGEGRVTQALPTITPSQFIPRVKSDRLATRLSTLVAVNSPDAFTIIDARAESHYRGEQSEAKRFGHIPTAIHIDGMENIDRLTGLLKSRAELEQLYAQVPKHKKVIVYCTKGLASSIEYLIMRELGYDVANYDASWQEWGNDDALPIQTYP